MYKTIIEKGGKQELHTLHETGRVLHDGPVLWDERTNGPLSQVNEDAVGALTGSGATLAVDSVALTALQADQAADAAAKVTQDTRKAGALVALDSAVANINVASSVVDLRGEVKVLAQIVQSLLGKTIDE